MRLNSKKIHEYVEKHQRDLTSLKLYLAKNQENSQYSAKSIIDINQEIKRHIKSINEHKPTLKTMKEFAQNTEQRQSSQKNAELIKNKSGNWISKCEEILEKVRESMRQIDSKNQKKQLSEQQIAEFKTFLTESMILYEENKEVFLTIIQAIIEHFATEQINSNCILLESLTNRMQRVGNK